MEAAQPERPMSTRAPANGYAYVWEYVVTPESAEAFERVYGPDGDWERFFQRDPAYLRTDLLRNLRDPSRYLTVDRWVSREACAAFRERYRVEFDALDARCDALTVQESLLGEYALLLGP